MTRSLPIVLLTLLCACSPSERSIPEGLPSESALREAILKMVPMGSSITDAQERTQAAGFECVYQWHAPWRDEQNLTYLYCHRDEGLLFVQRRWEVAFIMQGVVVGEVRVKAEPATS
ncbi:hypothetical protein YTPLAS18_21990 [Nitrospira sp.]|nr:hypothetical protein YTPLAS18_21990 [Nitrospira sp.]